jgi:hypothetical protein
MREIDECHPDWAHVDEIPDQVSEALRKAYPMPQTLADAYAEYAYWQRRSREIGLLLKKRPMTSFGALDAPAAYRYQFLIEPELAVGLQAASIGDVLWRQKFKAEADPELLEVYDVDRATELDLKALAAVPQQETVVSHEQFRAARQKREPSVQRKQASQVNQREFSF